MPDSRPIVVNPPYDQLWDYINAAATKVWPTCTVIWQNQTAQRPAKPYVSIGIANSKVVGRTDTGSYDPSTGLMQTITNTVVKLNIDLFGDGALFAAQQMQASCELPSVLLNLTNWGFNSRGPVTDISVLLDKTFSEQRARFSVLLNGTLRIVDDMSYIDKVTPPSGEYDQKSGSKLSC